MEDVPNEWLHGDPMDEGLSDQAHPKLNKMTITPLGAGNEVGRSCIILTYKGKNIMLDCGIHPAYQGLAALPFFDEIEPSTIDIVLITHYHLDHIASLPYFLEKTAFKGKVFMTHPTKAIYKWLLNDYVRVSHVSPEDQLYTEQDLVKSYDKITAVDYHQEIECDGIRFTCYNAGHVLGAAMFLIEIAGIKILYTGDYSKEEDRHLLPAEIPLGKSPDVMICESTYGVQSHEPRLERERRFTKAVHDVVARGGRCLLPVFALGKAQELLLILDEYWASHPSLQHIPIYFCSSLAKKCLSIYQTYLNILNPSVRKQMGSGGGSNPFVFKFISNVRNVEGFDDIGPCVMMTSPGMLQNGLSRELFEAWCTDKRNGVVVTGYSVEGTLAKMILNGPSEITALSGAKLPLNMSVDYISFSAHVDFIQNSQFIESVRPRHLVLVHGESNEMNRLRSALQHRFEEEEEKQEDEGKRKLTIYTPRNSETVELSFREELVAKAVGKLSESEWYPNQTVSGILVGKDFEYQLIDPEDLSEMTSLQTTLVRQRQWIVTHAPFSLIEHHVRQFLGPSHMQSTSIDDRKMLTLMRDIRMYEKEEGRILIEWNGSAMNDMMVDSIVTLILSADSRPSSLKLSQSVHGCCHHGSLATDGKIEAMLTDVDFQKQDPFSLLLSEFFERVKTMDNIEYHVDIDGQSYQLNLQDLTVTGPDERMVKQIKDIVALYSIASSEDLYVQ